MGTSYIGKNGVVFDMGANLREHQKDIPVFPLFAIDPAVKNGAMVVLSETQVSVLGHGTATVLTIYHPKTAELLRAYECEDGTGWLEKAKVV